MERERRRTRICRISDRMTRTPVRLTSAGLAHAARANFTNDFHFFVGDHHYECPRFVAAFLSPRIARLHRADPTIDRFELKASGSIADFLKLATGDEVIISSSNEAFLPNVAISLENHELLDTARAPLSIENGIERLKVKFENRFGFASELEFVASHFSEFKDGKFHDIDVELLRKIVSNQKLTIESDDSFYRFVSRRAHEDSCYFSLMEFVSFRDLSSLMISQFAELSVSMFNFVNLNIYRRFCEQFELDPKKKFIMCPCSILECLARHAGGNLCDKGIIEATASTCESFFRPIHATDGQANTLFHSKDCANQWLCYGFKKMTIKARHYSIRSHDSSRDSNYHLKSWVVETCDDGQNWQEVDRRVDNSDLNAIGALKVFEISKPRECRFIRLRQIGPNHHGSHYMIISSFDVFGEIYEDAE
jgi:hypothetical protein